MTTLEVNLTNFGVILTTLKVNLTNS